MFVKNYAFNESISRQMDDIKVQVDCIRDAFKNLADFNKMSFKVQEMDGRTIYLVNDKEQDVGIYQQLLYVKHSWKNYPANQAYPVIKVTLYNLEFSANSVRNKIYKLSGDEFNQATLLYDENISNAFKTLTAVMSPYITFNERCTCPESCNCIAKIQNVANMIFDSIKGLSVDWKW